MGRMIPPLGGGAGLNDELIQLGDGTLIRLQVLADLFRVRPKVGTWYGYYCPTCSHGWPQETPNWQRHAFDYLVKLANGDILAICCYCGGEWLLHEARDKSDGISVGSPILLKPATYRKPEEED